MFFPSLPPCQTASRGRFRRGNTLLMGSQGQGPRLVRAHSNLEFRTVVLAFVRSRIPGEKPTPEAREKISRQTAIERKRALALWMWEQLTR